MKAKDEKLPLWTLPNRLSIVRILFIPFIIICMEKGFLFLAFLLFIIAGITDGLDGFMARKLSMTTKFGLYLDPIADKLLVSSVLITLTYQHLVPLWVTIVLVCREFIINGLRAFYAMEGITIYPSFSGKLKTMLQIIGIACVLFNTGNNFFISDAVLDQIGLYILYAALFFSIFSAWNYIAAIFKPNPQDGN
ncbi:MAG TPA: CDP-diacylglycerol--glycerol-3-phosphate 3-phosphatidyltransferase [Syntrophorhabdaceae bacterium]|nr:CDP-diacylglycerol--glycerol-3-phosphate 3-phosphatidyltransferase [Syntrophorhabdaceae bacterium]